VRPKWASYYDLWSTEAAARSSERLAAAAGSHVLHDPVGPTRKREYVRGMKHDFMDTRRHCECWCACVGPGWRKQLCDRPLTFSVCSLSVWADVAGALSS
jgi:hypothetical protein